MAVDILVIGGSGFVGGRVLQAAGSHGMTAAYTYAHPRSNSDGAFSAYMVDLSQEDGALKDCLADARPRAVIYCAVPPVGSASDEPLHSQVSVLGVERLVHSLEPGTRLVYVSTNAVFSGWNSPYREDSPYEERQDRYRAYGLMRARGEQAALKGWANSVVVRTSHVEGRYAQGNLHWRLAEIVERLKSGQDLPQFTDRYLSPTWVGTLAEGLLEVCQPGFDYHGVLHIAGSQVVTDYTYCRLLARKLGVDETLVCPDRMDKTNSSGTYSMALDVRFTQSILKTPLPGIEACIENVLYG